MNRNAARGKGLTVEFLKSAAGIECDVRGEGRICLELQFIEMKRVRDHFGML